ncbi:hypothetical protein PoB_006636300 [Plakobranchus ocellatus]|uniref:Uncharacterized protein n=1 Tax=Plakobranchus ocellatus TaxID=259542 RepID=A0AAV4D6R7_9GAST|nr:hypothetical protein PoB_006636300 [Plakobranchus ocellatus]
MVSLSSMAVLFVFLSRLAIFLVQSYLEYVTHFFTGDLKLAGPPSGQGAGGGTRTRDGKVPADLKANSLANVPPKPSA